MLASVDTFMWSVLFGTDDRVQNHGSPRREAGRQLPLPTLRCSKHERVVAAVSLATPSITVPQLLQTALHTTDALV